MDWEAIGAVREIPGALAVVVSLLYLAQPGTHRFCNTASDIYSASFREFIDQASGNKHGMWRDDDETPQAT